MSMCALTVYFDFHLSVPPSTALCHQTKVQYWLVGWCPGWPRDLTSPTPLFPPHLAVTVTSSCHPIAHSVLARSQDVSVDDPVGQGPMDSGQTGTFNVPTKYLLYSQFLLKSSWHLGFCLDGNLNRSVFSIFTCILLLTTKKI